MSSEDLFLDSDAETQPPVYDKTSDSDSCSVNRQEDINYSSYNLTFASICENFTFASTRIRYPDLTEAQVYKSIYLPPIYSP